MAFEYWGHSIPETLEERLARGTALIVVDLRVGKPGAVIDEGVDELPARPARALGAHPGDRVTGLDEARMALGVHVQQRAGLRPFVATECLARLRAAPARNAVAPEHLPDRRARPPA